MTGVSLERLADTLYPKETPKDTHAYGTVESVNPDGSYQVKLNASATTTRCAKLCEASVGDRVMVVIQGNGHCAAIGRVGGEPFPPSIDLLWTNPNPTSAFPAQTLSGIPWQDYKVLVIDHFTVTDNVLGDHYETGMAPCVSRSAWTFLSSHRDVWFMRGMRMQTDNSVEFGDCFYATAYGSTNYFSTNGFAWVVPVRIYGIR